MAPKNAIKSAIDMAGTQSELAKMIGVKQSTVSGWVKDGRCGPTHAIKIHKVFKGKISAHDLRPDLYPRKLVEFKQVGGAR